MPPLECFYRNSAEDRGQHLFDLIQVNDVILCRVILKSFFVFLQIIFSFTLKLHRFQLRISKECCCQFWDLHPVRVNQDIFGTWDSKHDVLNEFCVVQERKDIYFSNFHLSFLLYMEKLECISFLKRMFTLSRFWRGIFPDRWHTV